jgi:hypothetical protein
MARALLVGARVAALVDDASALGLRVATALEARRRAVLARSPLLVSSALEAALKLPLPTPAPDGADNVADIVWVVAGERRAVVEERRSAARAATADKVRTATQAASAAARATAMPGALEDLGAAAPVVEPVIPDAGELARLRTEVKARLTQLEQSMMAARRTADEATAAARTARDGGDGAAAADADRRADGERARMHTLLGEMAGLERELRDLDAAAESARQARPRAAAAAAAQAKASSAAAPSSRRSVDDQLADLKRRGDGGAPRPSAARTAPPAASAGSGRGRPAAGADVDDELAALKRKMTEKKP